MDDAVGDIGLGTVSHREHEQAGDIAGRVVSTIPARPWAAGRWAAGWSEAAGTRTRLRAGMYFVRMMAAGRLAGQKKFILIE